MKFRLVHEITPTHAHVVGEYGFWRFLVVIVGLKARYGRRLRVIW